MVVAVSTAATAFGSEHPRRPRTRGSISGSGARRSTSTNATEQHRRRDERDGVAGQREHERAEAGGDEYRAGEVERGHAAPRRDKPAREGGASAAAGRRDVAAAAWSVDVA